LISGRKGGAGGTAQRGKSEKRARWNSTALTRVQKTANILGELDDGVGSIVRGGWGRGFRMKVAGVWGARKSTDAKCVRRGESKTKRTWGSLIRSEWGVRTYTCPRAKTKHSGNHRCRATSCMGHGGFTSRAGGGGEWEWCAYIFGTRGKNAGGLDRGRRVSTGRRRFERQRRTYTRSTLGEESEGD